MLRMIMAAMLAAGGVSCALAGNWIHQWNDAYWLNGDPNVPDPDYLEINQLFGWYQITIKQAKPNEPFEFEAVTYDAGGQYTGPGDINLVTAQDNAGTVVMTFVGHNGHDYGAANIQEINLLDHDGTTAIIQALTVSGSLGSLGPIRAARIEGNWQVGLDINDNVTLDSLFGELRCRNFENFTIRSAAPGPAGTRIISTSAGTYGYTLDVAGDVEYLEFDGPVSGHIHIRRDLLNIVLVSNLNQDGRLDIDRDAYDAYFVSSLRGPVTIGQHQRGFWDFLVGTIGGTLIIGGDLGGYLQFRTLDIEGTIDMGNLTGMIELWGGSLAATSLLRVRQDFTGTLSIGTWCNGENGCDLSGSVVVAGGYSGAISAARDIHGDVIIMGDMHGVIHGADMTGTLFVGGNMGGPQGPTYLHVANLLDLAGDMSGGHVIVNGWFGGGVQYNPCLIEIEGVMQPNTTFLAFNMTRLHLWSRGLTTAACGWAATRTPGTRRACTFGLCRAARAT